MPVDYDDLGAGYQASRGADVGIVGTLAALLRVDANGTYVDVGCGTGNYTRALAARGGRWHGVDPSAVMLAQASQSDVPVEWHRGSADALPFAACTFDGALCTNAIHHFTDLTRALTEVRRVMRVGRLVIFTGLAEQTANYWLGHYFPEMMRRSIALMPSEAVIRDALDKAGFTGTGIVPFDVDPELTDLFLYAGKDRPEIYLRAEVRANITSFARLCTPAELQHGLAALEHDLRSGDFDIVRASCRGDRGDYAFVVAGTDRADGGDQGVEGTQL